MTTYPTLLAVCSGSKDAVVPFIGGVGAGVGWGGVWGGSRGDGAQCEQLRTAALAPHGR